MVENFRHDLVLIFHVFEDGFYFFFGARVDFEVCLRARVGMSPLEVLSAHEERHEEDLDHVGDEEPEDESGKRIELPRGRRQEIPPEPHNRPRENDEEESHRTDSVGDEDGNPIKTTQIFFEFDINVAKRLAIFAELFEGNDGVWHICRRVYVL